MFITTINIHSLSTLAKYLTVLDVIRINVHQERSYAGSWRRFFLFLCSIIPLFQHSCFVPLLEVAQQLHLFNVDFDALHCSFVIEDGEETSNVGFKLKHPAHLSVLDYVGRCFQHHVNFSCEPKPARESIN